MTECLFLEGLPPSDKQGAPLLARHLIDVAFDDMSSAVLLFANRLEAQGAYSCAQAAEKGLKAVICSQAVPFPKTHSLPKLLEQCIGFGTVMWLGNNRETVLRDDADALERYLGQANTFARYPDEGVATLANTKNLPWTVHPVWSFHEYIVDDILPRAARLFNAAQLALRAVIGYEGRQHCYHCSVDARPLLLCPQCSRWVCLEDAGVKSVSEYVNARSVDYRDYLCDRCPLYYGSED